MTAEARQSLTKSGQMDTALSEYFSEIKSWIYLAWKYAEYHVLCISFYGLTKLLKETEGQKW